MPFCYKCGNKVNENVKYCPECGFELKKHSKPEKLKEEDSPKSTLTEKIIIKEKHSLFGSIIKIILVLALIGGIILITAYVIEEGGVEDLGNLVGCELEFKTCNRNCGEGWLGGLCKDKCAVEYNLCKDK